VQFQGWTGRCLTTGLVSPQEVNGVTAALAEELFEKGTYIALGP
jgi:hypothetical protein